MKRECAAWLARRLDLPAANCAIAQDANALIVERMPFPAQIGRLKEGELVFWKEWFVHLKRAHSKRVKGFWNRHRL
jgi:hypothetical protein